MTCFRPGTADAYREAASRCASLSTGPDKGTVPFSDCTLRFLPCKPESLFSLSCNWLLIWESFGAWLQATVMPIVAMSRMTEKYTVILAFIRARLGNY